MFYTDNVIVMTVKDGELTGRYVSGYPFAMKVTSYGSKQAVFSSPFSWVRVSSCHNVYGVRDWSFSRS